MHNANIVGVLDLSYAKIDAPILLTRCVFAERPVFDDATFVSLRMPGCTCPGIDATNLRVEGNLELNNNFTATGEVILLGAEVKGDLETSTAVLQDHGKRNGETRALDASRLNVHGAFLAVGLRAEGEMRMVSMRVGGLLDLEGATLTNPAGTAFHGERLVVGESLFLQDCVATGRVVLQNSSIGGGVDFARGSFGGAPAKSSCLQFVRAKVGRNVNLNAAKINGMLNARHASIARELVMEKCEFVQAAEVKGQPVPTRRTLSANLSHLSASTLNMLWACPPSTVDLRYAGADLVRDDPRTWPAAIHLDGFTYRSLESGSDTVTQRLQWLQRSKSDGYTPAPYDQLLAYYRLSGNERDARNVALAKERQRRRKLPPPARLGGYLLDATVGYGYRNFLAALWITLLVLIGAGVFSLDAPHAKADAPPFQPFIYAADLVLPIIDFGQEKAYVAGHDTQWVAWVLVAAGWILTTAVVAGIARVLNRK